MNASCLEHDLDQLCPELRSLAAAELAAGNDVVDSGTGLYGPETVLVQLRKDFQAPPAQLPPGVRYREVNDPHWWKAEYFHAPTGHCLVCGF